MDEKKARMEGLTYTLSVSLNAMEMATTLRARAVQLTDHELMDRMLDAADHLERAVGALEAWSVDVAGVDGRCGVFDDGRDLCVDGSWRDCGDHGRRSLGGSLLALNGGLVVGVCTEHHLEGAEHDDGDGDEDGDDLADAGAHGGSLVETEPANRNDGEVLDG